MPTVVACESCGKRLRIPDGSTATRARCPGCGAVVSLPETGITPAPAPPRPKRSESIKQSPDSEELVEVTLANDQAKRRKKKRRRRKKESSSDIPVWVWVGVGVMVLLLALFTVSAFVFSGHGLHLLAFAVGMAIALPVSVVILVVSMFITSAVMGGIDFGQAHIAIPKAAALLLAVSLISMIPLLGWLLALPVWLLGLMGLFQLDFSEARVLVLINWCLNSLFKIFVLGVIVSAILHGDAGEHRPKNGLPPDDEVPAVQEKDPPGQGPVRPRMRQER